MPVMDNEYFASINEVSKRLSIPAHTLRYWEKQFPVAIRPTTGAGGRRYYRAETVQRLEKIRELLYDRGMTIAGVKKMLREGTFPTGATPVNNSTPTDPAPQRAAVPQAQTLDRVGRVATTAEIDALINILTSARALLE